MIRLWLGSTIRRRTGRLIGAAAGIAVAVAMLVSIGAFLSASKATMTKRAAQQVAVDWQAQVQPGSDPSGALTTIRHVPGIAAALPVQFADVTGLQADTGGSTQSTGPGQAVGLPATYAATFPGELRLLSGSLQGVLVAQQTASNLHVAPGDNLLIGRQGLPQATVTVDGVVDLPQADSLFQHVGAPAGSQPTAPPDNVVLLPLDLWHRLFDPLAARRPDLIRSQIHIALRPDLPTDPAAAFSEVTRRAHHLELVSAGSVVVGDNLGAVLDAARSDALYSQVLFLFLGAPGAALAGILTTVVISAAADRRRREHSLLRARGATAGQLVALAAAEAIATGLIGDAVGVGVGAVVGRLAFGSFVFGATAAAAFVWALASSAVGLAIAALAVVVPAWRQARSLTVSSARRVVGRPAKPLWARLGVDLWCLVGSGAVFWLTGRNGYQLVLAPEGTPSISVSYWAFTGPLLLWAGAALLAWRVSQWALLRGRPALTRLVRPVAGPLASTVVAALGRQRALLSRVVVLIALALAFATSTAVFNSTYRQQAEVDARLTNGGDVTVTEPASGVAHPDLGPRLARVAGVAHVEPLQHRFAYVGTDLQDLYGVRPSSIVGATSLQDAYFQGGTARQLMARLAAHSDGILVSAETVRDFQLSPGDLLRLRLIDAATHQLVEVDFHYVGIAKEFPTAPRDSFLVANASYVARATHSPAVEEFLLAVRGSSPATVAARVRSVTGPGATVTDIQTTRRVVGSSLTAVDLSGLTRVELGFAIALAMAATGLVIALGLAERRRTFAIATMLGANRRHVSTFIWSESAFVAIAGLALGGLAGWSLAEMLVKVLTGVFDPPPTGLALPWGYLVLTLAAAVGSTAIASLAAVGWSRRRPLETLREL